VTRGVREESFEIAPGDVVLLYTDGLVERRDTDILVGLERLRSAGEKLLTGDPAGSGQARRAGTAQRAGAARRLLDVALDQLAEAGGSSDDVCALAIHRSGNVDAAAVTATQPAPARSLRAVLRPRPQSVAEARDQARAALVVWGLESLVERVTLVVSELVTNSVTHAGTPTVLELDLLELGQGGPVLRIAVCDQSVNEPELRAPDSSEERGRGVALVDTLTDRWGTTQRSSGKRVWAEIDLV
jgi:anti-sigma regulatory factor (Ser/Thr protein kinase)